ncbi:PF09351 domain protein [Leptospira kirschneri str. 200803703]|uniref:PF09351 domain protein n=2 Tax=Leptospira kirschneri TaxID=29507 RepID=A0A828Y6X5_9LEPT|nr:PF09351 domain protein [Leptospira kirschneri serovar Grippotyphosa str. RM52]EKO50982.1 PF09351 domain protein [Leptospira kirschneri str. 200802841]EKP07208.1 PF09351 domain protein [Leptospira kirschneri str. 2008720114]EKQ84112.1 PF09351 domain protein [Leptospira kirschneri serovar Grippotyphosa str. Moskva]EKR10146.1 PF09351 domain protein [Leptospira kirschneri serovar Valbuzzi str. 200702274]EMK02337.1 PF09351 domain protein [Leptospira kirschneri str. MMD1493]EMK16527.1 PF09351 do
MDRVLGRSTDFGQTLRFNLLSWKNSIIRKAFQKNEKNADSKKKETKRMLFEITIQQFTKMLHQLKLLLEKGVSYSETKKFDVEVLLNSRLAPDQFHFIKQIQIVCDTAKLGVSRLTGKDAPKHEDQEKTLSELQTRIDSTLNYLSTFTEKDFSEANDRKVSNPRWEGKYLTGKEFAIQHLIPNFYFHITTAYSILRHNGVDIGKKNYLGEMPFKS